MLAQGRPQRTAEIALCPARKFGRRILVNQPEAIRPDQPVCVDHILRGEGYDTNISIGRFLRELRRLSNEKVRQLHSAAGADTDDGCDRDGSRVVIREGERRLNRVRIDMKSLPWENWHDVYNEVIQPLANEGAEVSCQVVVIAKGEAAIRENTVELGIKESLSQRDIDADIQTG